MSEAETLPEDFEYEEDVEVLFVGVPVTKDFLASVDPEAGAEALARQAYETAKEIALERLKEEKKNV